MMIHRHSRWNSRYVYWVWLIVMIIGLSRNQAQLLRLTPEETAWLKEHTDDLVLAPVPNYPPIDYWDEKGRHQGVTADIIRLIEKRLDIRFKRVQLSSWQEIISQAQSKMIDIVPCAHQIPERDQFWLFTRSYL
ncbi:MAG: transporter substrate-binding domain-containing protein, partial [Candidatus Delongbacteria bacterium]|nr:transporter substrate-binding domain-containing protein [Candidatus Delongbacteria bacterium]